MKKRPVVAALILLIAGLSETGSLPPDTLPSLTLSFVGDIMAHTPNFTMNGYDRIYRAVSRPLLSDDLSFANLEFVVDEQRPMSSYPRFNVHSSYVEAAVRAGFDVFSLANNHSNDYGAAGIEQTMRSIEAIFAAADRPLFASGLRRNRNSPMRVESIHYENWRIGFLSVSGMSNTGGNSRLYFVPSENDDAVGELLHFIETWRPLYDLFILSWHGGVEYQLTPAQEKVELFHALMGAGVDILWGHHPHVLQPLEFSVRNDMRRGIIMYSLGNFISSQPTTLGPNDWNTTRAYTGDSAIVQLSIRMTKTGVSIADVELLPITHLQHFAEPAFTEGQGFETHFSGMAAQAASLPWKEFYYRRAETMRKLTHSFLSPYEGIDAFAP